MIVKVILTNILMSCYIAGVVLGRSSSRLPFTCPYKVPDDLPQPGEKLGGLKPDLDTGRFTEELNAQYRAALALVPCDGQAIQVFVEEDIPNKEYSVSVIYVFDKVVKELEKWLKEKFNAPSYENPIRDTVIKQCPEIAYELNNPYGSKISGEEILNILCEDNCTRTTNHKGYHALGKRSQTYNSYNTPEYQHPQHHYPAQQLPYITPQQQYTATNSSVYQPAPEVNQPHQPIYPVYPIQPQYPTVSHQQEGDTYNLISEHQKQEHSPYYKKVRFDDAPDLVYGVARRTRFITPCREIPDECQNLIDDDKVVDCSQQRFSECQGEWTDCVIEVESYLRNKTEYYEPSCNLEKFDFAGNTDLENASDNVCLENRCHRAEGDKPFFGYDPEDACSCDAKKEKAPDYSPSHYTRPYNTRFSRANGPVVTSAGTQTYVERSANGMTQKAVDGSVTERTKRYSQAQTNSKKQGQKHNDENRLGK